MLVLASISSSSRRPIEDVACRITIAMATKTTSTENHLQAVQRDKIRTTREL
ncbi:unnamed protein product [Hymenolepis diminuta]|uniref:Uncharacterized protein n=1 Tax=Hymenolepis diminuta TaxID=6216 RepID=A0A564YY90_HYMDI|nr:unnamed protein product [Hymenolepis diminuta]